MTRKFEVYISIFALLLLGCGGLNFIAPSTHTTQPTLTVSPLPSPTQPTITPILFPTYTVTVPPTETPVPTLTFTPTLTREPHWSRQGPGPIIVPILLYHHIGYSLQGDTKYYVTPEMFDQQMNLLYQWGYKTISVDLLVKAITQGADLPPKPVLLTFDDGSDTVYARALPIMQRYGFTGTAYIVYYYIGFTNYMKVDQIQALAAAGWEIGSHGLSHKDLTTPPYTQMDEVVESRKRLEALLGLPVLSFAYPFGAYDDDALSYVHKAGYLAAMGLGNETIQNDKNLFYLSRQAINGSEDLKIFALHLPWREDRYDLPTLTSVP